MADHTSRLPDEVIGYILSFLMVSDAVRARLSSSRWLQLPDLRSDLQFDRANVLGNEKFGKDGPSQTSMFVRIVDRYVELSTGNRISKLVVRFPLGNGRASHIDRWIATSIAMGVEEIECDFVGIREELYVFPSHLIYSGKAPYLKELYLKRCKLSLSSQCTSWLSNLTTLQLTFVELHENDWQHILCACSYLMTLIWSGCTLSGTLSINGQLLPLKKFVVHDFDLDAIKLNCPNLEVFEYAGSALLCFEHIPTLREASVCYTCTVADHCSKIFDNVTRNAPQLEALYLRITSEQLFPATVARCSLKRLYLKADLPIGFDFLNITNMFNASPFLETLQIKLDARKAINHSQRREYPDRPHFHLKEVKIEGFEDQCNEVELAMYVLRNAVALERMVIEVPKSASKAKQKATTLLLQKKINPTAEVIIL